MTFSQKKLARSVTKNKQGSDIFFTRGNQVEPTSMHVCAGKGRAVVSWLFPAVVSTMAMNMTEILRDKLDNEAHTPFYKTPPGLLSASPTPSTDDSCGGSAGAGGRQVTRSPAGPGRAGPPPSDGASRPCPGRCEAASPAGEPLLAAGPR